MIFGQLTLISFSFPAALVTLLHSVNIAPVVDRAIVPHAPGIFACLDANFAAPYNNTISSFSTDDVMKCARDPATARAIGGITTDANLMSLPPSFDNVIVLFRTLAKCTGLPQQTEQELGRQFFHDSCDSQGIGIQKLSFSLIFWFHRPRSVEIADFTIFWGSV
ncbi:hypothetical protein B0H14DRAFT_2643146 [Mycena olivaceomarginata]|nr:hypothetical protein B0H14DRAFT_2643146 [Mycena olivaceomarginata]